MMIKNAAKNKIISKDARLCDDLLSKFVGLMFSKNPETLILKFDKERMISLHMLFVFFPIDVLFLNKNKTIVDKKENFKPFSFCKSRKKAMYAVELLAGTIRKSKTDIGDKVRF